jgi:hypothetical protein
MGLVHEKVMEQGRSACAAQVAVRGQGRCTGQGAALKRGFSCL